jgi:glycerol-3-phosphate acyltransferase PlsX
VVIKFFEGLSGFIFDLLRAEFRSGIRGRLAYLLMRPSIARIRHVFDYEVVGGSPLLGVRGAVIITHGRARRRMIEHAVRVAATTARERVPERIAEALAHEAAREADAAAATDAAGATEPAVATEAAP